MTGAELDTLVQRLREIGDGSLAYPATAEAAADAITALREEIDRMREALEPFAARAKSLDHCAVALNTPSPYSDDKLVRVMLGQCRKARTALNGGRHQ